MSIEDSPTLPEQEEERGDGGLFVFVLKDN